MARVTAVVFEPGDPPRTGWLAFWDHGSIECRRVGDRSGRDVPETPTLNVGEPLRVAVTDAIPVLLRAARQQGNQPATFWGQAAVLALRLIARGRMLPSVSAGGFDAWRVGPLSPEDNERIRELAAAMPVEARAAPTEDRPPDAFDLVRGFLDAVADVMPRTAAAARAGGGQAFAAAEPQQVPELREWAVEVAAGRALPGEDQAGLRVSLRLETMDDDIERATFRAAVQVHSTGRVIDARDLWRDVDGDRDALGARARLDTALAVRRAARVWAPLERLLDRAVPDELELVDDEVEELLTGAAGRLTAVGVEVYWPRGLTRDLTAKAVVGSPTRPAPVHGLAPAPGRDLAEIQTGGFELLQDHGQEGFQRGFQGGLRGGSRGGLLDFNWRLAMGGEPLTEAEMDLVAEAHRPVVRLRGQWVLVDPGLARKARERRLKPLTAIEALGSALTGTADIDGERVEVTSAGWLDALRERIAEPDGAEPVPQPAALAGTLRNYQLRGLRWLARMTSLGLGGCLADDMGLGKTITLIALHLHRQADVTTTGPTLVVCPASLLGNWEREIERFAPGTRVRRFHGPERSLEEIRREVAGGFVLTTYATMRVDTETLCAHGWGLLVADEAQHVKNPLAATAKALRQIPATARVALTGTPVENNLSELWAILDWTTPGLLGTLTAFRTRWAAPIEAEQDAAAADMLSRLIRPFVLRRRKSDPGVAPELPAKTETDRPVALTHEQAGLYEAVVRETMAQIRTSSGMARRGLVVKLLTELKQICNHPAQYLKEPGTRLAGRSGKLELLDELVETITAEDGAVLVFTQYVAMARLIERHLASRGVPVQLLHGGTTVRRREEMVRRFQEGEAPVFLLSLKAAGTGLNLTRADHVLHYDRWWNPAVEEQATDRAHRIGQTRPVQVHRLVTEGTVEDRIAAMLQAKGELADAVLSVEGAEDAADAALTELSDAALADLIELRGSR